MFSFRTQSNCVEKVWVSLIEFYGNFAQFCFVWYTRIREGRLATNAGCISFWPMFYEEHNKLLFQLAIIASFMVRCNWALGIWAEGTLQLFAWVTTKWSLPSVQFLMPKAAFTESAIYFFFNLSEIGVCTDHSKSLQSLSSHYWPSTGSNHVKYNFYVKFMWKTWIFHRDFTESSHRFSHLISQRCEMTWNNHVKYLWNGLHFLT